MHEQEKGVGPARIEKTRELATATLQSGCNEEDEDSDAAAGVPLHATLEASAGQTPAGRGSAGRPCTRAKGQSAGVRRRRRRWTFRPDRPDEGGRRRRSVATAYVGVTRAVQKLTLACCEPAVCPERALSTAVALYRRAAGCVEDASASHGEPPVNHRDRARRLPSDTGYKLGQRVRHPKFGEGTIVDLEGSGRHRPAAGGF